MAKTANASSRPRSIDVASVMKAAQLLSGENDLKTLVEKLIVVVTETVKAEKIVFIMKRDGGLYIEAEGGSEKREIRALPSVPIEESRFVSPSVVRLVEKTKEALLLENASAAVLDSADRYLCENRPKSVLCVPVINKETVTGFLYMENTRTAGAFSPDVMDYLKVIAAQAAISIEKVLLYANLKSAEVALAESENRYRQLAEYVRDNIWIFDLEKFEYSYMSPSVRDMRGFTVEEAMSMPLEKTLTPESYEYVMKVLNEEMTQELASEKDLRRYRILDVDLYRKDGSVLNAEIMVTFIRNSEGLPVNIIGVTRDITERKRAQKELNRMRLYLKNIVDSMPSLIIGVDRKGIITQWNREAEMSTGVPAARALGCVMTDVIPGLAVRTESVVNSILHRSVHRESKILTKMGGQNRFSDVTVYPLISNGVEGAVVRIDDITERVHMEEMVIQSEKMISLGGFAAGMAHEIKNPLAGILQNAQLLKIRTTEDSPRNIAAARECGTDMDKIRAYMESRGIFSMIETIVESGRRAAKNVDNMLSFSRKSDSGEHSLCSMSDLLDKTVEILKIDYDLKKNYDFRRIGIIREYDRNVPGVFCEPSKIQQVYINVLKNGAYAMAEVDQRPSQFILRVKKEERWVRVEIEDNGPGMPEEIKNRIFEPFYTTKMMGVGTGLGLSVSHFIVTKTHGGTMSVESLPGRGTNFIIRLPYGRERG